MTYKFYTSLFALLFCSLVCIGQDDTMPNITDEMTADADQNAKWRDGDYGYTAKPKNAWEVGLHVGGFHVNGDVPSGNPCNPSGIGLHLRKAISYGLSWRLDLLYGTDRGLDGRETSVNVLALDNSTSDFSAYPDGGFTYRNFKNTSFGGSFNLIFNVGNLLFHKPNNKWNFYVGVGAGLMSTNVKMDYLNGNTPYDFSGVESQFGRGVNSSEKRSAIKDILDGEYETEFENDRNVPFIHDNGKLFMQGSFLVGVSRKINDRINISLEHQILAQDYDKLDGHEWRSTADQTNDSDIIHYSNIRIAFNLGSRDKSTEPLYWMNPLDATFNDIAALKKRPILDLTDEDGDNVIDMLDKEIGSKAGCAVDTRGITLDSDNDGLADCDDTEPYSPPGYEIDEKGVAQLPPAPTVLGEDDVIRILNANCPGCKVVETTECGEWFLPMIHFDLNKSNIKPEYYSQLHHVGTVLKKCPNACVTVHGHTDPRNSNDYNNALSYKRAKAAIDHLVTNYGVDRSRLKLMYGGEDSPLVSGLSASDKGQLLNRRVEFRLCDAGDYDMAMPEGTIEASNTGSGSIFKGNKNSGY